MAFHHLPRISRDTIEACFEGGCFCSCHLIQYAVLLYSNPLSDSPVIIALGFLTQLASCFREDTLTKRRFCIAVFTHLCALPCHCQVRKPKAVLLLTLHLIQFKLHRYHDLHVLGFSWSILWPRKLIILYLFSAFF